MVVCPGSRSQALALATAELAAAGRIRMRVRIDERSAGFLALGLAIESGRPVAVVVTSGTAVAELHPAVLEAAHAGVPLVVLAADRPAELRGTGANQATTQPGIFGHAVRVDIDVPAPADGDDHAAVAAGITDRLLGLAGPALLNLAFRAPLSSPGVPAAALPSRAGAGTDGPSAEPASNPLLLSPDAATLVVAGLGAGPGAEQLARELGAPLVAEVVSGAHFGPNLVPGPAELLDDERFGGRVRRVVVIGRPSIGRELPTLVARPDVETVVVRGPWREQWVPPGASVMLVDAVAVGDASEAGAPEVTADADTDAAAVRRAWLGSWTHTARAALERSARAEPAPDLNPTMALRERAASARAELAALRTGVDRRELVEAVWAASWPHDRVLFGASRLVRVADAVLPGKRLRVAANRGLAGIDGTVSTGVGVALAAAVDADRGGVTRVLLGDLTLLHDVGGLLFPEGEERPRVMLVVGNDHGGTIFDGLEVRASAPAELFDRVQLTPQRVDIAALAAAYGWEHRSVRSRGDLASALTAATGPTIVEVALER